MDGPERTVWFVGDLDDPWARGIGDAIPNVVARAYDSSWCDEISECAASPATLVLHRAYLSTVDAERLAKLRVKPASHIILCAGPHARYADIERWSALVDVVLSEATARETIGRYLAAFEGRRPVRPPGPRARVGIVSGNYELRRTLAEACESAGYPSEAASDWGEMTPGGAIVWDVPLVDSNWPRVLAKHSRLSKVVGLFGFADRSIVNQARGEGATACLDLPCDLADFVYVLDRVAGTRVEPAHDVPPGPALFRRGPRSVAESGPEVYN
jgi:hypothetical protein